MRVGLFMQPSHPPGTALHEAVEWDLQVLRWADEYGFSEAWIGEHFTIGWEPCPSPDIVIGQALRETRQIKLGGGTYLLPYHNPIELAHRLAFLDQISRGRTMIGVGAGAFVTDAQLFAVDGQNHAMTLEALEIMKKIWTAEGPFKFAGRFWGVDYPGYDPVQGGPSLKPWAKPYPPIGMAGLSPRSGSLRQAGELGLLPLSLNLSPNYLAGHWDVYAEGAAKAGRPVSRKDWRVGREFFVADTDEAAFQHAVGPFMGRAQREYLLPLFKRFGLIKHLLPDPTMAESDITPEYLARHVWLVGSPETVERKLRDHYAQTGGFGTQLGLTFDHSADPEPFRRSLELMGRVVIPRLSDLTGD
jgi:alkanesulfonate monooxygenase SsuD/methylene tetrahydromethanopterin reductase-like flavin-dependent oxidoreductase (luciferase family)